MEAVAVFALACNVIQVVECAIEVGHIVQQTYRKGDSNRNIDINASANHLSDLSQELLQTLNSSATSATLTSTEKRLRDIGRECHQIASELFQKTHKPQVNPTKLRALTRGIRVAWSKADIDKLLVKLQNHERLLETAILIDLRKQYDISTMLQQNSFKDLDDKQQQMIQNINANHTRISNLVTNEGSLTRDLIKDSHQSTESIVKSEGVTTRQLVAVGNNRILDLEANLHDKHQRAVNMQQREQLLNSLYYPEMNARINQKALDGYPKTCDFIFSDGDAGKGRITVDTDQPQGNSASFPTWLKYGNGMFWIQGKAGSGKSTMMKFISEHAKTTEYLKSWALPLQPSILSFFFWLAGSAPQNTMHGLLCSLLYQILQANMEEIVEMIDGYPQILMKKQTHDWSQKELVKQCKTSIFRSSKKSPTLILLDGLDELSEKESPRDLLDVIATWVIHRKVKICVASRAENVFTRAFRETPLLRLQDLTRASIQKYVWEELISRTQNDKSGSFKVDEKSQQELAQEIVRKAKGVFIWVRVAVNDVLDGLTDAADWDELLQRVRLLSPNIEKLYEDMLQRKHSNLALAGQEAALYFGLALYLKDKWYPADLDSIYVYAVARAKWIQNSTLSCFEAYESTQDLQKASREVVLRIQSLCAGLLEYIPSNRAVQFSHRTAQDFLLDSAAGQKFTSMLMLSQFDLAQSVLETSMLRYKIGLKVLGWDDVHELVMLVCDLQMYDVFTASQSRIFGQRTAANVPDLSILLRYLELRIPEMLSNSRHNQVKLEDEFNIRLPSDSSEYEYALASSPGKRRPLFAVDFAGLVLFSGKFEHFETFWIPILQAERNGGLQVKRDYKNYLLLCAIKGTRYQSPHGHRQVAIIRQLLDAGAEPNSRIYLPLFSPNKQNPVFYMAIGFYSWCLYHLVYDVESDYDPSEIMSIFVEMGADLATTGLVHIDFDNSFLDTFLLNDKYVRTSLILEVNIMWILCIMKSDMSRLWPEGARLLQGLIDNSAAESNCRLIGACYQKRNFSRSITVRLPPDLEQLIYTHLENFLGRNLLLFDIFLEHNSQHNGGSDRESDQETVNTTADTKNPFSRINAINIRKQRKLYKILSTYPKIDLEETLKSLGYMKDRTDPAVPQGPFVRFECQSADDTVAGK